MKLGIGIGPEYLRRIRWHGYHAVRVGDPCPYDEGTPEWQWWQRGWSEAHDLDGHRPPEPA